MPDNHSDRLNWIDVAKGIGILAVLLGHNIEQLQPIIYSFHMPLFFVLTGYTIKKVEKGQLLKATIKDAKRLLIPCLIARILILLGDCLIKHEAFISEFKILIVSLLWGNHYGTFHGMEVPTVGRIWFLIALFWAKLFYRKFMDWFGQKERFVILLMLSYVSMYFGTNGIVLPQNMDMIFLCMFLIEVGNLMKTFDFDNIKMWPAVLLVIFTLWTYLSTQWMWISMGSRVYPGYGVCVILAVMGCICVIEFSKAIAELKIAKPLIFYGQNSMILLVLQGIVMYFYWGQTYAQKFADMAIECLIVVVYVYAKKSFGRVFGKSGKGKQNYE